MSRLHAFGQEFYPHETIRALRLARKMPGCRRRTLVASIAAQLPQKSPQTRERIAGKIAQRYLSSEAAPLVRLVASQKHAASQIELLYWQLTKVDALVGQLAREVFHPICVQNRPPNGVSSDDLALRNGSQLVPTTPFVTRSFIAWHARENWNFSSDTTLDRSLRVLQSAGLIARHRMTGLRGHPAAFSRRECAVSLSTFAFALHDEFLPHLRDANFLLRRDALPLADFARTFLLSPSQVQTLCEAARERQLLAAHGDHLRFVFGNLDALTDALLDKAI